MGMWPSAAQGMRVLKRVLIGDERHTVRQSRGVGWYAFAQLSLAAAYLITGRLGLFRGLASPLSGPSRAPLRSRWGSLWLRLLFLQSFAGVTAATTLILAAVVPERHASEQRKE